MQIVAKQLFAEPQVQLRNYITNNTYNLIDCDRFTESNTQSIELHENQATTDKRDVKCPEIVDAGSPGPDLCPKDMR